MSPNWAAGELLAGGCWSLCRPLGPGCEGASCLGGSWAPELSRTSSGFCFTLVMLDASLLVVNKQTWVSRTSKFSILSTDVLLLPGLGWSWWWVCGLSHPVYLGKEDLKENSGGHVLSFTKEKSAAFFSCGVAVVYSALGVRILEMKTQA